MDNKEQQHDDFIRVEFKGAEIRSILDDTYGVGEQYIWLVYGPRGCWLVNSVTGNKVRGSTSFHGSLIGLPPIEYVEVLASSDRLLLVAAGIRRDTKYSEVRVLRLDIVPEVCYRGVVEVP